ncbi:hypothetical protein BJ322DRAFT_871746 [Thelephora terrestris]|uniref:Uncharacterized protein n=1 Tax=Thelephora terrestris TaxID=56493 RepID=A0A9P6HGF3_9AGAM|nr:hypothetical protein BJ322DRAFT_871746 [Thelephora terrestris]
MRAKSDSKSRKISVTEAGCLHGRARDVSSTAKINHPASSRSRSRALTVSHLSEGVRHSEESEQHGKSGGISTRWRVPVSRWSWRPGTLGHILIPADSHTFSSDHDQVVRERVGRERCLSSSVAEDWRQALMPVQDPLRRGGGRPADSTGSRGSHPHFPCPPRAADRDGVLPHRFNSPTELEKCGPQVSSPEIANTRSYRTRTGIHL